MKRNCIIVFALLLSVSVAGAALKKGPYLQRVTQEGITITWQTSSSTAGYVEVHGGASVVIVDSGAKGTLHSTVINGLEKAKEYTYKIFVDGKDSGEGGSFRTAVGPDKGYRFLVYGDNRTQHTQHEKVVAAMMKEQDIAFVLNTGDMVSSGNNESHWQTFFEIETKMLRHWAFFGAVGNHEEHDGHANNFVKYFTVPPGGSETYYSFRHGNALFIVTDGHVEIDNPVVCFISQQIAEDCFNEKQMAWIKTTLEAAKNDATIEHVFVATHMGPYSSKPGRTGSGQMRALLDQFKSNKVKVVMSGHDHYFEHGISGNGLHYIITGGGGAPLYETKPELSLLYPHEVLVSDSIHNYLVVTVAGNWVEVIAKDLDGKTLDSFEIGTEPACIEAKDCNNEKAGTCPGSWTCTESYQCLWSCASAPSCNQGSDCKEAQPSGTCKGDWTCINKACQWDCAQTGECSSDADCKDKKPLINCDNSYFKCDANVCEFYCPSGGTSTGGSDTGDGTAGTSDSGTGAQSSGDSATGKDSAGTSSSGCHHGPFHSDSGALWMFCLLLAAMVVRRRWS